MNLTKKLDAWEKRELITAAQKSAILDYEQKTGRPLFMFALLFLSVFCIGIGIIAVIASNWRDITPAVKLLADFLLLGAAAWGVYESRLRQKAVWTETFLVLFGILILASIGLVAQIYNLPPHGLQALLFWSVLTFPLVLFSDKKVFAFFWLPVFVISVWDCLLRQDTIARYIESFGYLYPGALPFIVMLAGAAIYLFFPAGAWREKPLFWSYRVWLIVYLVSYVLRLDIYSITIFRPNSLGGFQTYNTSNLVMWLILALCTGAFCWFGRKKGSFFWPLVLFILLDFSLVAKILPEESTLFELWGAALSLSVLALTAVYAYRANNARLLNLATILMALRFFIIYLQVFGSLLSTGIGLIISGLVLLATALIWQKSRRRMISKLKESENA